MGIELGINLFMYGGEVFHKPILHLLCVGYDLLGREPYVDIIQVLRSCDPLLFYKLHYFLHPVAILGQSNFKTDHLECTLLFVWSVQ